MENFNPKKLEMFSVIVPTILFSQVFTYQAAYKLYSIQCKLFGKQIFTVAGCKYINILKVELQ